MRVDPLIRTVAGLREALAPARDAGAAIGLVPTMGALHEGHEALIRRARERDDVVVVSIFVNPLQFDDPTDLAAYPRTLEADVRAAVDAGADWVFAPVVEELHPSPILVSVRVGGVTERLEGAVRPGHFDGVATVVTKLFTVTAPTRAYFGEKDFQQLLVVRRLVAELHLPVEVVAVETVRDPGGLALSSRNRRLSPVGLREARRVAQILARHCASARVGDDAAAFRTRLLADLGGVDLDYVEVAEPPLLEPTRALTPASRVLAAWRVEGVRLIDNRAIGGADG